eukprot:Sspe_Gene.42599::Locus_20694_Transcript_1_2_Confidence_1.000_Length_1353::g.42599::m.42599
MVSQSDAQALAVRLKQAELRHAKWRSAAQTATVMMLLRLVPYLAQALREMDSVRRVSALVSSLIACIIAAVARYRRRRQITDAPLSPTPHPASPRDVPFTLGTQIREGHLGTPNASFASPGSPAKGRQLQGRWEVRLDECEGDFDALMAMQGMSWLVRKTLQPLIAGRVVQRYSFSDDSMSLTLEIVTPLRKQ